MMPDAKRSYLFVGGNPRSGTTLMWRVLSEHPGVALGLERFPKAFSQGTMAPALFEEERFFEANPADHDNPGQAVSLVDGLRERYRDAIYVGDKHPLLHKHYELILDRFTPVRIVFIVRNPFLMAESHQTRHDDPDDRFSSDGMAAIKMWNNGLRRTRQFLDADAPIRVVSYEKVFASLENVQRLYDVLGLDIKAANSTRLKGHLDIVKSRLTRTALRHEALAAHVSAHANFNLYKTLTRDHCIFADLDLSEDMPEERAPA